MNTCQTACLMNCICNLVDHLLDFSGGNRNKGGRSQPGKGGFVNEHDYLFIGLSGKQPGLPGRFHGNALNDHLPDGVVKISGSTFNVLDPGEHGKRTGDLSLDSNEIIPTLNGISKLIQPLSPIMTDPEPGFSQCVRVFKHSHILFKKGQHVVVKIGSADVKENAPFRVGQVFLSDAGDSFGKLGHHPFIRVAR